MIRKARHGLLLLARRQRSQNGRKETENVDLPASPSVPHYAFWLEQVFEACYGQVWFSFGGATMVVRNVEEKRRGTGRLWKVRAMGLDIGTALLKRAQGHLRRDLFLRQLKANSSTGTLRGRQIMKLIMQ